MKDFTLTSFISFTAEIFSAKALSIVVSAFAIVFFPDIRSSERILPSKTALLFLTTFNTLLYGASKNPNSLILANIASCVTTPMFALSGLVTGSNFE